MRLKDSVSQESDKKESQAQMENKPLETNKPSASAKTDKSSQKKDSETKT